VKWRNVTHHLLFPGLYAAEGCLRVWPCSSCHFFHYFAPQAAGLPQQAITQKGIYNFAPPALLLQAPILRLRDLIDINYEQVSEMQTGSELHVRKTYKATSI
jgi:hypothetical protein